MSRSSLHRPKPNDSGFSVSPRASRSPSLVALLLAGECRLARTRTVNEEGLSIPILIMLNFLAHKILVKRYVHVSLFINDAYEVQLWATTPDSANNVV